VEDLLASLLGMFDHYRAAPASDAPHRPSDLPASLPSLHDPLKLVATYGIAVPQTIGCETLDQAISAASIIGFPVVLKGNVTSMTHKSELQAVKLGLKSAADIEAAWRDIAASVAAHNLADAFSGCIVQEQVVPGVELLAPFGPSSPQIWPAGTEKDTSFSASLLPNDLVTASTSTKGGTTPLFSAKRPPSAHSQPAVPH
jgi:hypothetical protein